MAAPLQSPKGFKDLLPPDSSRTAAFEAQARRTLELYGFREIRLPTLESSELYDKSTGETSDIVEKEMFRLEDQGGRKLALRPEGTPGVVRAYLQHSLAQQGGVCKLYYIGSMFRAERPQAGRFREFEQIGAETLGNPHPAADVESILALKSIFDQSGIEALRLRINNIGCDDSPECRPAFRQELKAYLQARSSELCENCRRRLERNPLRALDCKADGNKLGGAPRLAPCGGCTEHYRAVLEALSGIDAVDDPSLVRGLDYYTRTVFEFQSGSLGAQDAIAGGGRYDKLVESMGGQKTPAVGWALGVERCLAAAGAPAEAPRGVAVYVASASPSASPEAIRLVEGLRRSGLRAEGALFASSLKAQLREAERHQARFTALLGEAELAKGVCTLKDMASRTQKEVPLSKVTEEISPK